MDEELWYVPEGSAEDQDKLTTNSFKFERIFKVSPGSFYLGVFDRAGDGLCCSYGNGYIQVSNPLTGHILLRGDGNFGGKKEFYFDVNSNGKTDYVGNSPRAQDSPTTMVTFQPETDDPEWPGQLFSVDRNGGKTGITINIRYDMYPAETMWAWEKLITKTTPSQLMPSNNATANNDQVVSKPSTQKVGVWEKLDSKPNVGKGMELFSYDENTEPSTLYRFQVSDSSKDGSCCTWGPGFFTITSSTEVIWKLVGNKFDTNHEVFIWVNKMGEPQVARYIPGLGYVVTIETDSGSGIEVVARDKAS